MRPVSKGNAPRIYNRYDHARDDLFQQIGMYCSYCEMPIQNMAEVEHVIPLDNGGAELDWGNFLPACKYCNTSKSNRNLTRDNYFWPDRDNTLRAFLYSQGIQISPALNLTIIETACARATIDLCKLDRQPGSDNPPTERDTRWMGRDRAWNIAIDSLINLNEVPNEKMENQIVLTAIGTGYFSVWMEVFHEERSIRQKLIEAFPGTAQDCFDQYFQPIHRPGGNL